MKYNYMIKQTLASVGIHKLGKVIHIGAHHAQELEIYESMGVGHVTWIEPDPKQRDRLKAIESDKHKVIMAAASDECGEVWLNIFSISSCNSIMKPAGIVGSIDMDGNPITLEGGVIVPCITIDSLNLTDIDLMVIDTEGAELKVLKGAVNLLKTLNHVYLEYHTQYLYEGQPYKHSFDLFLEPYGFKKVSENMEGGQLWGNVLFSRICR
jgi:FkbM family methyltransferase